MPGSGLQVTQNKYMKEEYTVGLLTTRLASWAVGALLRHSRCAMSRIPQTTGLSWLRLFPILTTIVLMVTQSVEEAPHSLVGTGSENILRDVRPVRKRQAPCRSAPQRHMSGSSRTLMSVRLIWSSFYIDGCLTLINVVRPCISRGHLASSLDMCYVTRV